MPQQRKTKVERRRTIASSEQEAAFTIGITLESGSRCLLSLTQAFGKLPLPRMSAFSFETYTKKGVEIISTVAGREVGRVAIRDVESWNAYPEMTFDIVELRLIGGEVVRWLDRQNDLLTILRSEIGTRERST